MTGARIQHMNPLLSDVCHLCSSDRETLSHLFWECIEVRKFWGLVFQMLQVLVPGYHVPGPELVHIVNPFPLLPKRSEEHTSELQSLRHLVCRLLLEKKK